MNGRSRDKIDLSIIIVSWNVKELLLKCLDSIFNNQGNLDFEVFIVDNASTDGTIGEIRNKKLETRNFNSEIIANKENLGFAKANNQAIQKAQGEFILLLNPDTEILDNALEKMVNFMRKNKNCGVAGCKLLNPDGSIQPSVRRFPGFCSQAMILLKLHHLFPNARLIKKYFAKDFDYSKTQQAEQVMGAFFMIRREVIEKVGMLDENFFIWFEEVDFCKRVKNAGWEVYYTPEAEIIHYGAQSFNQVISLKKQKMFNKSLLYYFKKHKPWWQWLELWSFQPASLALAGLASLLKQKGTDSNSL